MVEIEEWIPKFILGYLIYLAFLIPIMASATQVTANIYDLTVEQKAVLENPATDISVTLNKFFVLSTVNSTFAIVSGITIILGIIFILAVATAINEFIPFT